MSYQYTFNYPNGRRADLGVYSGDRKEILKMAMELSKKKGRTIAVRRHTYDWYNDSNYAVAWVENGKIISGGQF